MAEVTCYVQAGKEKSERLCNAFASGVRANGGKARVSSDCDTLLPGAAVFYGVRPNQRGLLEQAKAQARDFWYIDNAYFDKTRETYFRITLNRLQHHGVGASDGSRFRAIGQDIEPWRKSGSHVLVCPQSDEFMDTFCEDGSKWESLTVAKLKTITQREIRVRAWQSNKINWYKTLPEDLRDCWALVTYSSASAISAMLSGIPAFVTAHDCISRVIANTELEAIDHPHYVFNLQPWANVVADHQFTVAEIASGFAWSSLVREARSWSPDSEVPYRGIRP